MTTAERFFEKVDAEGPCWLWTGATKRGYGVFRDGHGRAARAHRWAYEHLVGPIGKGLVIDHLCRVNGCVNPDHMEPVTNRENLRRSPIIHKTHCWKGHRFTKATSLFVDGYRRCRIYNRERCKERRARLRRSES